MKISKLKSNRVSAVVFASAIAAVTCSSPNLAFAKDPLNGWHRTMLAFAQEFTRGVDAERGFTVEYNSYFADIDYGTVLAPAADSGHSSMNILRRCAYDRADIVESTGLEIPALQTTGTFKFGANATAPPDFATSALANAKAEASIDRKRDVSYAFNDLGIGQLTQSAAEESVNASGCLSKLTGVDRIYVVRGHVLMRLMLAQSRNGTASANASLERKVTTDPAKVGFNVAWTKNQEWALEQKVARPWFRIVGRMERGADGKFHFVKAFQK